MKLVYIASPYHADTPEEMERNKQAALDACEQAYIIGRRTGYDVVPITPLVNFPYLDENNRDEREQAMKLGLAFLTKCDEVWCAGDHVSEGMKGEIRAAMRMEKLVFSMGMEQAKIQAAIEDMRPMLDNGCCYKRSDEKNYTGQLLVLKESVLAPWAMEPENQLWVASHGNGCRPSAIGKSVYATNLIDGEDARFDRHDFYGVAIPARLPDWAREAFSQFQQNQNNEESEEMEHED